jgi:uncharacterized protein YjbI with pentapeptide repeats
MANTEHLSKLSESIEAWNEWRRANPDIIPDLSYADLSNTDLRNTNLSNTDLSNTDLSNTDLRYANLRNANLRNADLSYANLSNTDLRNADLRNADLRNTDLSNTDLRNANLRNADLSNTDLFGGYTMNGCKFTRAPISVEGFHFHLIEWSLGKVKLGCRVWTVDGLRAHFGRNIDVQTPKRQRSSVLAMAEAILAQQAALGGVERIEAEKEG